MSKSSVLGGASRRPGRDGAPARKGPAAARRSARSARKPSASRASEPSARDHRVLRAIYSLRSPTRAEIARHASLSVVSVTSILNRLMAAGRVRLGGKTDSKGGRPSTLYSLSAALGCSVGIALESSRFHLIVRDTGGATLQDRELALALSARPEAHLAELTRQLVAEFRRLQSGVLKGRRVLAAGIAPSGMVDTERGVWLHGLQLSGIEQVDLRAVLQKAFRVPVVVEDPARALAWLHASRLPPEEARELVLLDLTSGVGAGLIVGGELFRGSHGLSGEVGHLVVDAAGDRCSCGSAGCLETVVSVPSILRRFRRRLEEGVISSLQRYNGDGGGELTLARISEAGLAGDRLARSTLFEIGAFLGDACATLVKLYNPRTMLITGPAAILGEMLIEPIWQRVRQHVMAEMLADLTISFAPWTPADEAFGAALIAERSYWSAPGA